MFDSIITPLLTIIAIGTGLMAGVYFAFSSFIMRSLDCLDVANAVETMNAINTVILRSWFIPLFFGTSLLALLLAVLALLNWDAPHAPLSLAIGLIYCGGMFLSTLLFNVPLNNRLEQAKDDSEKNQLWPHYYKY